MNKNDIIKSMKSLSDKQFIELLYEVVKGRFIYKGEENYTQSHLVVANACRLKNDNNKDWGEWSLELIAKHDSKIYPKGWADDSLICQSGECCGHEVISWAKNAICPICGKEVYTS